MIRVCPFCCLLFVVECWGRFVSVDLPRRLGDCLCVLFLWFCVVTW